MLMPSLFGETFFDDFDNFFDTAREARKNNFRAPQMMKTDITEKEDGYDLTMDLPGYKKEDVKAELKDGNLTISAETSTSTDEKGEDGKFIRRERYSGSCKRTFYVGKDLKQEDIKAKFENGTLKLFIPKKQPEPQVEENSYITID